MSKQSPTRRTSFDVRGQLIGKLGPRGYGRLLDQLRELAAEPAPKRRPKRRPRRKAAA